VRKLLALLPERVEGARRVVLSDYGKGCLNADVIQAVDRERENGARAVLVDPKGEDYARTAARRS
jgi:bifunctional ADP-heptose synthase (sugar kinase/adenylyltransferase)